MKAKKINKWVKEIKTLNKKLAKIERILEEQLSKPQPVTVVEVTKAPEVIEMPAPEVEAPVVKKRSPRTVKGAKVVKKTTSAKSETSTKRRGRPVGWKKATETVAEAETEMVTSVVEVSDSEVSVEAPVKRRGRPAGFKKTVETVAETINETISEIPLAETPEAETTVTEEVVEQPAKRRGRPAGWKKATVEISKAEESAVPLVKRRGRPAGWKKPVENTGIPLVETASEKVKTQSKRSSGWKKLSKGQA